MENNCSQMLLHSTVILSDCKQTGQVGLCFLDEHRTFKQPAFCWEHKTGNSKMTTPCPLLPRPTPAPSKYLEHSKFYHCVWYLTGTGYGEPSAETMDPMTFPSAASASPPPRTLGLSKAPLSLLPTLSFPRRECTLSNLPGKGVQNCF